MVRETRHLWVGNLPENIREDRIREHFKRYGRLQSVKLLPRAKEEEGATGLSATVAFVDIKSASKAHNMEQKLDERCLSTEYYEPPIPGTSQAPLYVASRFPRGVPEEHVTFDRTSLFYERGGSGGGGGGAGGAREGDAYLRRPPASGYHVAGDPLRGRGRERPYRNGPLPPPYTQIIDRPPPPHHRPLVASTWNYEAPPSVRYPTVPPTVEPYTEERRDPPPVVHKKRPKSSRSGSESGSNSASSRSRSRTRSRSSSSSSNSASSSCTSGASSPVEGSPHSSRTARSGRVGGVAVQSTVSTPHANNASPAVHAEDRRSHSICVRNLPIRSSDTSLKDGLFHEYKKHGKVTWVKVVGLGTERYALVCFKKPEDVEKALEISHDKLFFGCKIEVAPYQGYDVDDNESRPYEAELDEYHPKATRTLFIGNLEKDVTASELRKHFEQFGEIIEIDIKKQGVVSSYAFCQYADITSVVKAMRTMDGEHLGNNRIKLGFGKSMPTNCVWVDGVAENVSEKYLNVQFHQFGSISHVTIDRERGHALVYFEQIPYAQEAVRDMRGVTQRGRKLQVDFASRECQETFYEHLEKQGHAVVGGERPWDRYDNNRETPPSRFDAPAATPPARFARYEGGSGGTAGAAARPRPVASYGARAGSGSTPPAAAVGSLPPAGAARPRAVRTPGQRYAQPEFYDDVGAEYPERRYSRSYDDVSQGSPGSHGDPFDHADYGYCPRTSPAPVAGDRLVAVSADKATVEEEGYKRLQSVVADVISAPPPPPPDMRHLQKERVHLLEQLEECPSSGDDDITPMKRPKVLDNMDLPPGMSSANCFEPLPHETSTLVITTHNHRKSISEVRRLSDASGKHCGRRPSCDSAAHPVCKRRKTGEGDERCRKHTHHHHHHAGGGDANDAADGSRPGTPLCDERPENLLPPSEPRRPRERASEGPLSLPLPRFASQVLTSRVLSGKPVIASPPHSTSPRVPVAHPPPSPSPAPPPSSPPPRPPSLPSSSSSDSEMGPPSPTLEERIRSLDEKYEKWSGSRNILPPAETMAKLDAAGDRFRFRHKLLDLNELKPSDIVRSVLAKPSVFDEDSKRLENVGDKYEPKEFVGYKGTGCFVSLRVKTESGPPAKGGSFSPALTRVAAASPLHSPGAPPPKSPFAAGPTMPPSPPPTAPNTPKTGPVSPRAPAGAAPPPAAKGLQYPFPSHPPVLPPATPPPPPPATAFDARTCVVAAGKPLVPAHQNDPRSRVAAQPPAAAAPPPSAYCVPASSKSPAAVAAEAARTLVKACEETVTRLPTVSFPSLPGPTALTTPPAQAKKVCASTAAPALPPRITPAPAAPRLAKPFDSMPKNFKECGTFVAAAVPSAPGEACVPAAHGAGAQSVPVHFSGTEHSKPSAKPKPVPTVKVPAPNAKRDPVVTIKKEKEDSKIISSHRSKSLEEKKERKDSVSSVCQRRESEGAERRSEKERRREKDNAETWDSKKEIKKECIEPERKDVADNDRLGWGDKAPSDIKAECAEILDRRRDAPAEDKWREPADTSARDRWKERDGYDKERDKERRRENLADQSRVRESSDVKNQAADSLDRRKDSEVAEHLDRRKDKEPEQSSEIIEKRRDKELTDSIQRRKSTDGSEKRRNRESPENAERRKESDGDKKHEGTEAGERRKERESADGLDKRKERTDEDKRKERNEDDKRKERSEDDKRKERSEEDKRKERNEEDKRKERSEDDKRKERNEDDKRKERSEEDKRKERNEDEKRKERSEEDKRRERRKERANSVNSPAVIGAKRRISSQDGEGDEAKRPKLGERRDSKDSGRSSGSSSKRGPHHSFAKPHDGKHEGAERKRHDHEKLREKLRKKNREGGAKVGKEAMDERETSTSPKPAKRKDDSDAEDKEDAKQRHLKRELLDKKRLSKDDSVSEFSEEKARSAKKDREKRGSSEKRKDDAQSPVKDELKALKKESRIHKMSNSDTDSDDEDGPKKHSIFDIVDDGPAYISMYDKVKARSTKNMQKQEEEKRQEKMREKFSLLKASRAKREEKKRSTSWDEDSDSDMDPEARRAKRAGKPVISSSSEDESHRRRSFDGEEIKRGDSEMAVKKEDLGLGDSDSDSHHRLKPARPNDDEAASKHVSRKTSRSKLISDTSDDDTRLPSFKPNSMSEVYSAESDADQGFADADVDDRPPSLKKSSHKNHSKFSKSVMDSLNDEAIRKPIIDITKGIKDKNSSFKKSLNKSKSSKDWSDEEKSKAVSDKSDIFDEDKLAAIFKSKSNNKIKTSKSAFNSSDEEQTRKQITEAMKAEIFGDEKHMNFHKKSNNKVKVIKRCLDSSDDDLTRKLLSSTPKADSKIGNKIKNSKNSPDSFDDESTPRPFASESDKPATMNDISPADKYNSHAKTSVLSVFTDGDHNLTTPTQSDKKSSFFGNSLDKSAESSRKKAHKKKQKRLKELLSSEDGPNKAREAMENHSEIKLKSEKKHKRERRKSDHGDDQNKLNKIRKKKLLKPEGLAVKADKRDGKMEDIFGPISDDSESGISSIGKSLPNGGHALDKLPSKWQVSMVYGSDSDSVEPAAAAAPNKDRERKRRDRKRRERKARSDDGADMAEAGRALEAKLLGGNDFSATLDNNHDGKDADEFAFNDDAGVAEKAKEKEKKKKRKKSKEEKQNKHHHHHHHEKKSASETKSLPDNTGLPVSHAPSLPSLDVTPSDAKLAIETLSITPPTANAAPCKISPRSLDKKKADKFIPSFDAAIHETAVKSISEFEPAAKAAPPVKPEPPKKSAAPKEEVGGDEDKPRAVISQEETEDAVAALLGESFGADFADCYDAERSPPAAGHAHPDDEETRAAVEGLIDMKPDTPQSEPDLQIDTDTEEDDRYSGIGFGREETSRSSDNIDFSKPPKTPDMPASYYRKEGAEQLPTPPTYPKAIPLKEDSPNPPPVPVRLPTVVPSEVKDVPKLPEPIAPIAVPEKPKAMPAVVDVKPLPRPVELPKPVVLKVAEKVVEKLPSLPLLEPVKESLVPASVIKAPSPAPIKPVEVHAETVIKSQESAKKDEVLKERLPMADNIIKEFKPYRLEDPAIVKGLTLPLPAIKEDNKLVNNIDFGRLDKAKQTENMINQEDDFSEPETDLKSDTDFVTNLLKSDSLTRGLSVDDSTPEMEKVEMNFKPFNDVKLEPVSVIKEMDSLPLRLSERDAFSHKSLINSCQDPMSVHKENHSDFMNDAVRADTGFWSSKEVNIDSVIKKVDALCSAEEDERPWLNSIKEKKVPDSPIDEKLDIPCLEVAEEVKENHAPGTTEKDVSSLEVPAIAQRAQSEDRLSSAEAELVTPDTDSRVTSGSSPEDDAGDTNDSTPQRGGKNKRGAAARRKTPSRAAVATRRTRLAQKPTDNVTAPVSPRRGGRPPKSANRSADSLKVPRNAAPQSSDVYEFHDDSEDEGAEDKSRPRLIVTIKSSAPPEPSAPAPAVQPPPVAVVAAPVIAAVAPAEETEDPAGAPAANTRKSRRLQERDGSRSTVDDTIEDVVRGAAPLTRGAASRRQVKLGSPAPTPRGPAEPRKSPRAGKRSAAARLSESQDDALPRKMEEELTDEAVAKGPETKEEPIKEPEPALPPAGPVPAKPTIPIGMILKPRAAGDSEEPMTLIDPVTGLLIPMRESEEGQYIPVASAAGRGPPSTAVPVPVPVIAQSPAPSAAKTAATKSAVPETKPPGQPAVQPTAQVPSQMPAKAIAVPAGLPKPLITSAPTPVPVNLQIPSKVAPAKVPVALPVKPMTSQPVVQQQMKQIVPQPQLQQQMKPMTPQPQLQQQMKPMVPQPQLQQQMKPMTPQPQLQQQMKPMAPQPQLQQQMKPMATQQPQHQQQMKPMVPQPQPQQQQQMKPMVPQPQQQQMKPMTPQPQLQQQMKPMTPQPQLQQQMKPMIPQPQLQQQIKPLTPQPPLVAYKPKAGSTPVLHPKPPAPAISPSHKTVPAGVLGQKTHRPPSPAVHATASPPKAHQGLGPPPILTGAVASPPLKSSQQPVVTGASSSRVQMPNAAHGKGMMIPPKVDVSMGGCMPSASPQPQRSGQVMQAGMPVPAYEAASMGDVVQHVFQHQHGMRPAPHEVGFHNMHPSLMYQQYLRAHIPYHQMPGGVRSPMMPGMEAKLEAESEESRAGSPPLELRRPASSGSRGSSVPHSLQSPHDRLTDSPQVATVYMHGSRIPHYTPRYYEPEPPPAHVRTARLHPLPGSEAPATQPMMQVATPPHASQVPPQADSLLMLLQRYPVMWQGLLALKNDQAAVQMHFVFGNPNVARDSLPCNSDGSTAPLRIAQRMRLEQTQVEGVARKMQMDNEHCMLLALPCGRDHMDVLQQSNNLQTGFITYLQQKQAAGIVNIAGPVTQQAAYVVHIFPSCDFANENLARIAPDLLHRVADIAHLLIIIATV